MGFRLGHEMEGGGRKGGLWFGAVMCSGTMMAELICESGGRR